MDTALLLKKRPNATNSLALSKCEKWKFEKETEFYNVQDSGHISRAIVNQQVENVMSASGVEVLAKSLGSEDHGISQQKPFSKTQRDKLIKQGLSSVSLGGTQCELKRCTLLTKDGKRVPLKHGVKCEYMVWTYEASFSKHAMEDPVGTMRSFAKHIAAGCNVPLLDLRVVAMMDVAMMDGCIQFIIQGVQAVQAIITALLPLIGHEAATLVVSTGVASMWGAAIGTGVCPGIGTAIGAGVGAVAGIFIGVGGLLLQQRRMQIENQPQQEQQPPAPGGP